MENLGECRFSYWDGSAWQTTWEEDKGRLPQMIKINFKFRDETKEQEFLVKIPVSS